MGDSKLSCGRRLSAVAGLLCALWGCAETPASLSNELSSAQGAEARLGGMLRRPVSLRPEVAGVLFEVQAVAERAARFGVARGRHSEVVQLARRSLAELGVIYDSLERNCTAARAESTPYELARERGQDIVLNLREHEDAQFDRNYVSTVAVLSGELAELLDTLVAPRSTDDEAKERDRLRDTLLGQEQRAQALLALLE